MDRLILIGNPGNRRTEGLQEARRKLGMPPAVVVPYLDLLRGRTSLEQTAELAELRGGRSPVLRLDAPGELFEVERELIALGAPDAPAELADDRLLPYGAWNDPQPLPVKAALSIQEQRGRLYHPSQWFRGYGRLLAMVEKRAKELWPHGRWINAPDDIAAMFDKRYTHRVLTAANVPVPKRLAPPEQLPDYETLREMMSQRRLHRLFIKLAAGSGACGVIAYQTNPVTGAELAVTTIGVESYNTRPPAYYNAVKLRRYTGSQEIRSIINWLLAHGAHIEQWIAKAAYMGHSYDIRQLVVGGEACHRIARVSPTPITNLHLRSQRKTLDEVGLNSSEQDTVKDCAERALAAFGGSTVAGVDVLLDSRLKKPYIVDVNPFGDLLYRVEYSGCNPYEWEMRRLGETFSPFSPMGKERSEPAERKNEY
ncbi:STM4014 family protein [Paenibacillus oceani]|uniref:STM4014 family protein n=1 Tax=Paenibacillus oceani TaxID=2772510 RepID=A0A927H088_9BACL|nr:STM4014 family protein [Paenibacillus oceani]MBD2863058.1 STM4014 family protein [Paenibacillus oceani]